MTNELPSREFQRAFTTGGCLCVIDCGHCGRVHFTSAPGHGDYEEGELEALQEKAKKHPDRYIEDTEFDSIEWCYLDGQQYVLHCPCGTAKRHEDWIIEHENELIEFLVARAKKKKAKAQLDMEEAKFALGKLGQ